MPLFCLRKYIRIILTPIIYALWLKMKCSFAKCTSIHVKREWVMKRTPGATAASHFILLMRTDLWLWQVSDFVCLTQIRWAARTRSRSKERRAWRKDNQEAQGQDCVDHQTPQGEPRLRRDSTTDYAADNSSEHSSTATPLTQSPRHRVLNVQHGNHGLILRSGVLYTCTDVERQTARHLTYVLAWRY